MNDAIRPEEATPWQRWALPAILIAAALVRLYHINAPLVDLAAYKQVFVANKARWIAAKPFNLFRDTFDFLEPDGQRHARTEEAPVYTGLLAGAYRLFGEHEWFGRVLSLLATLVAIAALYGITQRDFGRPVALLAAFLFSWSPLLIAYGRAFQPDPCMLAGMLVTVWCHGRYLDGHGRRWLLAACAAGALAPLVKYYALMALVPLAYQTWRARGWREWFRLPFLVLGLAMIVPTGVWLVFGFFARPNPTATSPFFIFQMPELICQPTLYSRFLDRFLFKDLGPITMLLLVLGVAAALARRIDARPVYGWALMSVAFYFLLGPLLRCHVYYEMMLLPGACVGAALGWTWLWQVAADRWRLTGGGWQVAVLLMLAVVQSPLFFHSGFESADGLLVLARRLRAHCSPTGRIVVAGPVDSLSVVHYARHEGWVLGEERPNIPWTKYLASCKAKGAEYVGVYLSDEMSSAQRAACLELVHLLPVVEEGSGPWSPKGRTITYYVLSLKEGV